MTINATLGYIRHDQKTLMLFRNKKQNDIHLGKWNGLGGKMERNETPEECIIREVFEESGLQVHHPILKGILTFPDFDGMNDWLVFVFLITKFSGRLHSSSEGSLAWINNHSLLDIPLWEGDRIFLPWLDQMDFFSGKFVYSEGILLHHHVIFYPPNISA